MGRHTPMQDMVEKEGRVACIGVLLIDQEGSQHQRAGATREQENGLGGRYSIGVGRLRQLHWQRMRPGAMPCQEAQTLHSEN
jgi:hypothetical protein